MDTPALPFDDDGTPLYRAFLEFHGKNPHVYEMFERFALQAINAGRGRFGSKAIFERLRWYAAFETRGDPWKLNNNYTAYYARLFHRRHPEHADFFAIRVTKGVGA